MAGWFPRPGLLWPSGVPAAGSQMFVSWEQRLTRVRPWQSKYNFPKKLALPMGFPCCLCDPAGPRAAKRRTQGHPVPAGWIPQGGGRPRLWRSLVTFWRQKVTPAERPCQAGKPDPSPRRKSIPPTRLTPGHLPLHKGGFGPGNHRGQRSIPRRKNTPGPVGPGVFGSL